MTQRLYCDGGVIGRNPSPTGGTWAWVLISTQSGEILSFDSGVITPEEVGLPVTNNVSELYAAVRALEHVLPVWNGTLYTDSNVTRWRITTGKKWSGVPSWLKDRALAARQRYTQQVVLLGGHPTRDELFKGHRKDGMPVSRWNVYCDEECARQGRIFLAKPTVAT